MSTRQLVCQLSELPSGGFKVIQIEKQIIAVRNENGTLYAFEERCPHRGGPLSEGVFEKGTVLCPWHQAHFDLPQKTVLSGPAKTCVAVYSVSVEDDLVWLNL